jgi:hypothetical protein
MKRNAWILAISLLVIGGLIFAQGMFGGYNGYGMMGGYGGGYGNGHGMMGGWDYIPPSVQQPITIDEAAQQATKYLTAWGYNGLRVSEIMEFSNHFYVEVVEKDSSNKAVELLVNKYTGEVFYEPGPNMMWNQKYGPMTGSMMHGFVTGIEPTAGTMPISAEKARALAQKFLDAQNIGLKVEDGADTFYGYYTIHVLQNGRTYGMLGVNGYTGEVWYHNWHGTFVSMKEFD